MTNNTKEALEVQWEQWWCATKYCQVVLTGYTDKNLRLASLESYKAGYKQALQRQSEVEGLVRELISDHERHIVIDTTLNKLKQLMENENE